MFCDINGTKPDTTSGFVPKIGHASAVFCRGVFVFDTFRILETNHPHQQLLSMAEDAVSRKISKLVEDEGMSQDQAVAVAKDMKRKGKLKTPAENVEHFSEVPEAAEDPVPQPQSWSQTPNEETIETASPAGRTLPNAAAGRPSAVVENSGTEQRGTSPNTKRAETVVKTNVGEQSEMPEKVQSFSDAEV